MAGTWEGGRTPVCVWYVRGVCVVNTNAGEGSPHPNCFHIHFRPSPVATSSYENSKHDQRFRFSFFPLKVDLN